MNFYKKHPGYRLLLKEISARYGKDTADKICADALRGLDALQREYSALPEKVKYHTDKNIFPRIAIYRVMQREMPGDALALLDSASRQGRRALKPPFSLYHGVPGYAGRFRPDVCVYGEKIIRRAGGLQPHIPRRHAARDTLRYHALPILRVL